MCMNCTYNGTSLLWKPLGQNKYGPCVHVYKLIAIAYIIIQCCSNTELSVKG